MALNLLQFSVCNSDSRNTKRFTRRMGGEKIPSLTDETNYSDWKKRVKIWQIGTATKKPQQAATLIGWMTGKPEEVAIQIDIEKISDVGGVDYLLLELDKLFEEDKTQSVFAAIDCFNSYRRPENSTMDEYIREFQQRYKTLVQIRGKGELYEDGIIAFQLLHQSNLNSEQQRLIRATVSELSYANMEAALKRTFGEGTSLSVHQTKINPYLTAEKTEPPQIKEEPVFYSNNNSYRREVQNEYNSSSGRSSDSEGRDHYPARPNYLNRNNNYYQSHNRRYNPYERGSQNHQGQRKSPLKHSSKKSPKKRTCYICNSEQHLIADCPDNQYNKKQHENARVSYYQYEVASQQERTAVQYDESEMQDKGVLDTGAASTLCGRRWFNSYMDRCHIQDKVKATECHKTFRFGDGRVFASKVKIVLPVSVCGLDTWIDVYLVDNLVQLLISHETMAELHLTIDVGKRKISAYGREDDLTITNSGHMAMRIYNGP